MATASGELIVSNVHRQQGTARPRRGFTLLEALIATGILFGVVVAVTGAITAAQQHAYEAHRCIAGTLAAEELMGRLIAEDYDSLPAWNGFTEAVGAMQDVEGAAMPASFDMIGRDVQVVASLEVIQELGVAVSGRRARVRAFGADGRTLCQLTHFVPSPQELPES
jgi:hypothetical protein